MVMLCVVGPGLGFGAGAAAGPGEVRGAGVLKASLAEAMNRALSAGVKTRPVENTIGRCAMRTVGSFDRVGTPPGMSPLGLWPKAEDRHTTADNRTVSFFKEMPFFGAAKNETCHRGSAADCRSIARPTQPRPEKTRQKTRDYLRASSSIITNNTTGISANPAYIASLAPLTPSLLRSDGRRASSSTPTSSWCSSSHAISAAVA